jgi:regulator of nonsense transcripts 2
MADKCDQWAGWPDERKLQESSADEKKGTKVDGPKRRGYQETRKYDRDRRDNWRRKEAQQSSKSNQEGSKDEIKDTQVASKMGSRITETGVGGSTVDKYAKENPSHNRDHLGKKESGSTKDDDQGGAARLHRRGGAKPQEEENAARKEQEEKSRKEQEEQSKAEEQERQKQESEEQLKKEEMSQLEDYVSEVQDRLTFRAELRARNLAATESRVDISECGKLESNLKKNNAFVKKLKNLTESQKDSLTKDFQTLNLSKYIGEAAAAIADAKLKMSDVNCALHICSLLHQRYADFTQALLDNWNKVLLTKKDEKVPNPSKLRVDLRLFADIVSVGVVTEKVGLPILANQLMLLISNDKEGHNNLAIILSFCRHCGDDYAGLVPRKFRILSERHGVSIPHSGLLHEERQKGCRHLLRDYYASLAKHMLSAHTQLHALEKQNRKIMQTKGELSSERKERQEAAQVAYVKLLQNTAALADLLDDDLPELPQEALKADDPGSVDIYCPSDKEFEYAGENSLFEDEDTRQFYENFPDLKAIIPGILYKDSVPQSEKNEESKPSDSVEELLDVEAVEREVEAAVDEGEDDEREAAAVDQAALLDDAGDEDIASSMKLILDSFLANLPNSVNRELIDKSAIDFCMNMNTKANRKKLVKTLFGVNRTRYDLLPFYARLVAVLHPVMPDVADDLANLLKGDFRWHVRKKDQINIESKLKTVRFIGELTKFKMFPVFEVFHCVKMLLFDFSHHNIEMACGLFDVCGRFLYRSPLSHHRTKVYLDVMMRKKSALHLDSRYAALIENAYYYSNPPEGKQEERKKRPPMHQYIRRLLYKDLNKVGTEKVLRQLRKLPWDDSEIASYITKCITAIWNVRYNIIHCVANLLAGIAPYHEEHAIAAVDGILEDIRLSMELNHPKYNQRRVCAVKFLGELYNYRMVESSVIFKMLYSFISYGVILEEGEVSPLDPPEHLLRLRLVSVLVDTCGQYFDRGSSKKKLDCFLIYFQRYYWFKKQNPIWNENRPFPMDIEYMVEDTVEGVRPKWKMADTYQQALEEAQKLDEEFRAKLEAVLPKLSKTSEEGDEALPTIQEGDDEMDLDDLSQGHSQLAGEDEASQNSTTQDSDYAPTGDSEDVHTGSPSYSRSHSQGDITQSNDESESGDEDGDMLDSAGEDLEEDDIRLLTGGPKTIKCTEDDDFMSSLDKMMMDNLQQRSSESVKVTPVDIAVPMHLRNSSNNQKAKVTVVSGLLPGTLMPTPQPQPEEEETGNTINFMLLTRKGNKQQLNQLSVPVSEEFAARYKERNEQERAEKEHMKKVVLDIHIRQEEEDNQEMLANLNRPLALASTHREKKVKYMHPKGAPDADLIFGSTKK